MIVGEARNNLVSFIIFFLNIYFCLISMNDVGNNWGPNQSYGGGGGGPMRSNYTSNNRTTPYGNPGSCI